MNHTTKSRLTILALACLTVAATAQAQNAPAGSLAAAAQKAISQNPEVTARLNALDTEQKAHTATPAHFFKMMKQLTVLGYFTSEIGASQALIYEESPGRFDGNLPYTKGDRYFFTPPSRNL